MGVMEDLIDTQVNGKSLAKVETLTLDNCKSKNIKGLTDEFIKLEKLSFKDSGLTSLDGLPKLPKLTWLNLEANQLDGEDLTRLVESCPNLEHLILSGNPIKELKKFETLKNLKSLKVLDLTGCKVGDTADHRKAVLDMLPKLQELSQQKRDGSKVATAAKVEKDDDDEGEDAEEEGEDSDDDEEDEDETPGKKKPSMADLMREGDVSDGEDDDEFAEGSAESEEESDVESDEDEDEKSGAGSPAKGTAKGMKRKLDEEEDDDEDDE